MSTTLPSIDRSKILLELPSNLPVELPRTNLVERAQVWANLQPNNVAYYFTDGESDKDPAITYAELDHAARAVAVELQKHAAPGDRAVLMFPPGLDFVIAYFGCLYAGCVAVPAFPPRRNRKGNRIHNIIQDCNARIGLTDAATASQISKDEATAEEVRQLQLIATDTIDKTLAIRYRHIDISGDHLAMLQYTSGSTGQPKGVMLSHANLIRNCEMIAHLFELRTSDVGVSWLPAYHDMGLIGGILSPHFMGLSMCLMSPMTFLQRPVRWLRVLSKYKGVISGAPNFAYQLCVDKVTDEELQGLDLSPWRVAFNGAEPVRSRTMEAFSERFASAGFRHTAHLPTYGMAETTLIVTAGPSGGEPVVRHFHGRFLDRRSVEMIDDPEDDDARSLVGCGRIAPNETVLIVDVDTRAVLREDEIGEIWISSPSVGQGYWEKPEASEATFNAFTADGQGPFLRSGDLGFFHERQLYVAGRVKDLIIVRGVNRYPQDIEQTVEECHESIISGSAAAFADSSGRRERLIIAVEVQRSLETDWKPVIDAIRRSVVLVHELPPDAVLLVRSGSLPRTSSGKIQRHACLNGFHDGSLRIVAEWIGWEANDGDAAPMIAASTTGGNGAASHRAVTTKKTVDPDPEIVDLVKKVIRSVAEERAKVLDLDTNIVVDLGLDSLERLQIAHSLESAFGGRFPEDVLSEIETVREIAEALAEHFGKNKMRGEFQTASGTEVVAERELEPGDYLFEQLPEYRRLKRTIEQFGLTGLPNPYFTVHESVTRDTTQIEGKSYISFASYNYLGMSGHPAVTAAVVDAVRTYGTSVSASRLVSGEKPLHRKLERAIADLIGVDDAVVMVGGHSTNESVIGHLVDEQDLILHDALSHNSIVQGALLSGAKRRAFTHNDWREMEEILRRSRKRYRRVLVVVEGVYSMDGDFPDLPNFVRAVKENHAWLMVDEAHSIGTMGPTGRGIAEHFGVDPRDVDVWMGTLSKSFGSCGGYIAGSHALVEYLKYTAPGFVFSVGLSPSNAAAALASIEVLHQEPALVTRLHEAARLFLGEVKKRGLNTGSSEGTPVVPVITGNSLHALQLSRKLFERGINVQPILYPAVEESAARLRFFINTTHTNQQIMYAAELTAESLRKITPEAFRGH